MRIRLLFGAMIGALVVAIAGPLGATPLPQSDRTLPLASVPLIDIKLKCKVIEGKFICFNQKNSQNKCAGPNSCGSGYRDLEQPNKYGACCEQIKGGSSGGSGGSGGSQQGNSGGNQPTSGGCRTVQSMGQMSCRAPFGAMSCGPVQNGQMTCCCVK